MHLQQTRSSVDDPARAGEPCWFALFSSCEINHVSRGVGGNCGKGRGTWPMGTVRSPKAVIGDQATSFEASILSNSLVTRLRKLSAN